MLLTLLGCHAAWAGDLFAKKTKAKKDAGNYLTRLEFIEDKEHRWTIADIASPTFKGKFKRVDPDKMNFGFSKSVVWVRFTVLPYTLHKDFIFEVGYPLIDKIDLYSLARNGEWYVRKSGDIYAFSQREINYRNVTFRIKSDPEKEQIFYARFETSGSMQLPLKLWAWDDFIDASLTQQICFGLLGGVFMVMIAYGFIIGIYSKNTLYFLYSIAIASSLIVIVTFNGYAFQYVWNSSVIWGNLVLPISIGFLSFTMISFIRNFMETHEITPILDILLKVVAISGIGIMVLAFLTDYTTAMQLSIINGSLSSVLAFYGIIICRARGNDAARFAVTGMYFYVLGIFLSTLRSFGILESTFFSLYGFELGAVVQAIMFAVSLNDKYSIMSRFRQGYEH